jgi:hypothetical protein
MHGLFDTPATTWPRSAQCSSAGHFRRRSTHAHSYMQTPRAARTARPHWSMRPLRTAGDGRRACHPHSASETVILHGAPERFERATPCHGSSPLMAPLFWLVKARTRSSDCCPVAPRGRARGRTSCPNGATAGTALPAAGDLQDGGERGRGGE